MSQYEERLTRLNEHMETSNRSYLRAQDDLKQMRLKQEGSQRARDTFLTALIDRSTVLKQKILKPKLGSAASCREALAELELNLPRIVELKPGHAEDAQSSEL